MVHLWLRSETKPRERRVALAPKDAKTLLECGFQLTVEQSADRVFADSEYADLGANVRLMPSGSWQTEAPNDAFVLGLKELSDSDTFPLVHRHILFAHCFKLQRGWERVLGRFAAGGGTLLDLEFLADDAGRRVAAFGHFAGFVGAALGIMLWAAQRQNGTNATLGALEAFPNAEALLACTRASLQENGPPPRVMVLGALGRCGRGAVELLRAVGVPADCITQWDVAETSARPGPYPEIVAHNVLVNCIYLTTPIPPFVTREMLAATPPPNLSVVVDVSCDPTNPANPLPIYTQCTTLDAPETPAAAGNVQVIAIDHLPTLLPREASLAFSHDLVSSLVALSEYSTSAVWQRALALFRSKLSEAGL